MNGESPTLTPRQLDEAFELPDAGGVAHFAQRLGLDLADALAGDLELAARFTTTCPLFSAPPY
jgi:hypothetical protein